jgi:hypothetical protein
MELLKLKNSTFSKNTEKVKATDKTLYKGMLADGNDSKATYSTTHQWLGFL